MRYNATWLCPARSVGSSLHAKCTRCLSGIAKDLSDIGSKPELRDGNAMRLYRLVQHIADVVAREVRLQLANASLCHVVLRVGVEQRRTFGFTLRQRVS